MKWHRSHLCHTDIFNFFSKFNGRMEVQLVEGHNNNKACKFTYLLKSYILNYFYLISGANLSCKSQKYICIYLWTVYFRDFSWKFVTEIIFKYSLKLLFSYSSRVHTIYCGCHRRKISSYHCMLSDHSKTRKTGNVKELVLARVEKNGIPVYIVAALLEMPDFSVTDAILLKEVLDSVFKTTNIFVGSPNKANMCNFWWRKHEQ